MSKKFVDEEIETEEVDVVLSDKSIYSSNELPQEEVSSLLVVPSKQNLKHELYSHDLYDPEDPKVYNHYKTMSVSSMFQPSYFKYPVVVDPGVDDALFSDMPGDIVYPEDGQDIYLALCKEHKLCPVRIFHRGLLSSKINLQYYCVDPKNVFAMSKALKRNKTVETFDLTDSFFNLDACYHLMEMLTDNTKISELNLSGCKIGPEGARILFHGLLSNVALKVLNLNKNELGDEGGKYIAHALLRGCQLTDIYLSKNSIGSEAAAAFAEVFEFKNNLKILDISWNFFFSSVGSTEMIKQLKSNPRLETLNLSWNGMAGRVFAHAIRNVLSAHRLSVLNLSYNKFAGKDLEIMFGHFGKNSTLHTLDLSNNPLTCEDALFVLTKIGHPWVNVKNLLMENVLVTNVFVNTVADIRQLENKQDIVVTYGEVTYGEIYTKHCLIGVSPKLIVLSRINYLLNKNRGRKVDLGLFLMRLRRNRTMTMGEFILTVRKAGAIIDDDCLEVLFEAFPGPIIDMAKHLDIATMVDFMRRKWPEKELQTPEPSSPSKTVKKVKPKQKCNRK